MALPREVTPPARHYDHRLFDNARWQGFEPREDDIMVCTSYKAGTTWMQMICALLVFQRTEFDRPLNEMSVWVDLKREPVEDVHAAYAAQTHRRIIKSHTPLDGLPWFPSATYIMVGRDPRDIFMSLSNQLQNLNPDSLAAFKVAERAAGFVPPPLPEDIDELFRLWMTEASFPWEKDGFPMWSAMHHAASFWPHRREPNIVLVHYADLEADLKGEMRRIAALLGIEIDETKWPELVEAAKFSSMKKNADRLAPDANLKMWTDNSRFFNKGTSGQWRDALSVESLELFERRTAANYPPDLMAWLINGSSALPP